jgi:hypothetical protein
MSYLGETYDFKDVPAYDIEGEKIKINGRHVVEEFLPYEPSAYVWSPCFLLIPEGVDDSSAEVLAVTVDADDLERAVDPEAVERREAQEREWEEEQIQAEARIAEEETEMYHHRFMGGEAL